MALVQLVLRAVVRGVVSQLIGGLMAYLKAHPSFWPRMLTGCRSVVTLALVLFFWAVMLLLLAGVLALEMVR
jgi:hypothetical protein